MRAWRVFGPILDCGPQCIAATRVLVRRGTLMTQISKISLVLLALLASAAIARAQQMRDARVADIVEAGKLHFGLFPPQYVKDPLTGELKSAWVEVARAL